jgi:multiple sugar transport system substrate-binding protein
MRRFVVLLALLLLGSVAFAQLRMWTTQVQPERMEVQEQLVADFEAETGISVEVIPVEESELASRITAAFSAGDLPDVIYHPVSQTIGWAEAGILDIDAATAAIEALGEDTFARGMLDLVETQGGYAAVPTDGWTQLLVYRSDLFEEHGLEPPTTFEAIQAAIEALHDPPEMYGFVAATDVNNDYMMQVLEHFFLANGVHLLAEDGSIGLAAEPTVETLEFYKTLADASPEGNLYWQQSRELYLDGSAAMIVWSPFILDELAGLRDSVPVTFTDDPTSSDLASVTGFVTNLAGPSNPGGAGWAASSNWGITVDADTDAAQRFVEYVLSGDGYLSWLAMAPEGLFPVRSGTTDDPSAFIDGWSQLDVGVDRKASLQALYGEDVVNDIVEGLSVANRWAYGQGEGALLSRLYGTRVMAELVRSYLDDERGAEETAELLQQRVSALR